MSSEDQEPTELLERESSSGEDEEEEEDDSSEESSGEPDNEQQQQPPAAVAGGGGEGEGDEESSSSSEDSVSEVEEGEEGEEGDRAREVPPMESSPWKPDESSNQVVPVSEEGGGEGEGGDTELPNSQTLFGEETTSSSSSDSEDEEEEEGGPAVIGLDGGSEESEREERVEEEEKEEEVGGGGSGTPLPSSDEDFKTDKPERRRARIESDEAMESEDGTGPSEDRPSQTVEGLFGDAADLSSSESEEERDGGRREEEEEEEERQRSEIVKELEADVGEEETEVPRINVEIPRCTATLGSDLYFVKLPNFLSVETRPFDAALYEDEVEDDNEILDEEGRARLKLKVENTIRWRYSQDEGGNEVRESNARVVRWSDGTMSLYLGSEIFDIHRQPLQGEYSHLFVRQGTGLQGQAVFHSKLTFRPHSTDSQTHRKMTLSIADRFSKAQKIRVLPAVGLDPESMKKEKIKKEEERLRAAVRKENQQKRMKERNSQRGLTASYIEPDREDEDEGASLTAIKSSVRNRLSEARGTRGGGVWGGAESDEESSGAEEGVERLMRAKREEVESRKRHRELPEVDVTRKKQSRRLQSDDSEESD